MFTTLEWSHKAACARVDPEIFFNGKVAEAKAVCATCPVIAECLEHALSMPENYGVWGGKTVNERKEMD